jgi:hypothetical protein
MLNKILFFILCGIIIIFLMNKNTSTSENFDNPPFEAPPYVERKVMPSTQIVIPRNNLSKVNILKGLLKDKADINEPPNYNQIFVDDIEDLTYYENDVLNQSKINENAYDIINQIDLVDYGKVTTGMEKCKKNCNGVCLELGYTGSATCFPTTTPFDYGTLYKNPTFTYGLDTHKYVKI